MKNLKLMMVAGLMAFAASANAQGTIKCLAAQDVDFEGTQADLIVSIDYDAEEGEQIGCWQFKLVLPEGVAPIYDEDEEEWLGEVSTDTNTKRLAKGGLNINPTADGGYLVFGFDTKGVQEMVSTHGTLCTITLSGSADIKGEGKLATVALSNLKNESVHQGEFEDVTFLVNGGTVSDAINDIKSADTTAPAYNLQGIRVNNAKGLIIRDGKKMVVK